MVNITSEDWEKDGYSTNNTINITKESAKLVNVIKPTYYGGKDSVYEVFNVLEAWELDKDFYLGNVIKYIAGAGKKTKSEKEDLEKALVYLQRKIKNL